MSIGMRNAVKVVRGAIGRTTTMSETEAKEYILTVIDEYRKQKILDADKYIFHCTLTNLLQGHLW